MDALNHLSDGAVVAIVIAVSLLIFAVLWLTDNGEHDDQSTDKDKTFPLE